MSSDNEATHGFGPLGYLKVDFDDEIAFEKMFKDSEDRIAGFLFEPIQGERDRDYHSCKWLSKSCYWTYLEV